MSARAATFLAEWTRDNAYRIADNGGSARVDALMADAHSLGIGLGEFEEEVGDVRAHLAGAAPQDAAERYRALGEGGGSDA